jgi:hypothetical protein
MKMRIATGIACLAVSVGCAGRASNATTGIAQSASARREACQPVDSSFALGAPVFRECGVDREARVRGRQPRMDFNPRSIKACYNVVVVVVIDERGAPVPATAKVVRTNDSEFAQAFLSTLPAWDFTPAEKDGMPVMQVVEIGQAAMTRVVRSDRPTRPPVPTRQPNC